MDETIDNFNNIDDPYIKAYNRVVIANNFQKSRQDTLAKEYLAQFDTSDQFDIAEIIHSIKTHGWDTIKTIVAKRGSE